MPSRLRFVAVLSCALVAGFRTELCAQDQSAQTAATDARKGGSVSVTGGASGGTAQQNSLTVDAVAFVEPGLDPNGFHSIFNLHAQTNYTNAQKTGQSRIVTTDMRYLEGRESFDLRRHPEGAHGQGASSPLWLYAVVSGYHHIAFGLNSEAAVGGGLSFAVPHVPGLAADADLRYIAERLDGGPDVDAMAMRLHESFSHTWTQDQPAPSNCSCVQPPPRVVATVGESFEIVPAFGHSDALQARFLVTLTIPVNNGFSFQTAFATDYLENAAPGYQPRYWKSSVGINYAFGDK
jgi:hypothetical protein